MALIVCPDCRTQVSDQAHACPKCGRPLRRAVAPPPAPPKIPWYHSHLVVGISLLFCLPIGLILMWTANRWALWLRIAVTAVAGLAVIATLSADKGPSQIAPPPARESLSQSFEEVDDIFGADSKLTDLQKDELWKDYEGKYVTWTGELTYLKEGLGGGGISAGFRHKPGTLTYDVLVSFPNTLRGKLLNYTEGQVLTYTGKLDTRTGAILPYSLDGKDVRE